MIAIGKSLFQYLGGAIAAVFSLVIVLGITVVLLARLLGVNLEPYVVESARLLGGGKLIDFEEAFAASPNANIRVCEIQRVDTDGDSFKEWLVFYQFDIVGDRTWKKPCPDQSPRAAAIYDNDRGSPAILFPYLLSPPDSDYLGETGVRVEQHEAIANFGAATDAPIKELFFFGYGSTQRLTVFKFQQNTPDWENPTNAVPRYQLIGSFAGTGGITYNESSRQVTVLDRGPFERSQLAIKNVYQLEGPDNGKSFFQANSLNLNAPIKSTIDFGTRPPQDIYSSPFPEKILLAFYQAVDPDRERGWEPAGFLASDSEAAKKLAAGDYGYFGFPGQNPVSKLAVTQLDYFPQEEQVSATQTLAGPQAVTAQVQINVSMPLDNETYTTGPIRFDLVFTSGQWKISKRVY